MVQTVRERILVELKSQLETMQPPDYDTTWHLVSRTPYDREHLRVDTALSILDATETNTGLISNIIENEMSVIIEFYLRNDRFNEASTLVNSTIGDLKKFILTHRQLVESGSGKCLTTNMNITSVASNIDGFNDRFLDGIIEVQITYRHKFDDPTKLISE